MGDAVVWSHGRIFTGRRYVESVLAEDGRVVAAGSERTVRRGVPTGADRVDLRGHRAVPGLADAHVHLPEIARRVAGVDLQGSRSLDDVGRRVRAWARRNPEGPVYGDGWDTDRLRERRPPTARDLGRWLGDRPAVLYHVSHHAATVSDSVLSDLGIDETTREPPGGRIGRTGGGAPDGQLFENALAPLRGWGERAFARYPLGLETTLATATSFGLTSLGPVSCSVREVEAVEAMARRARLPVRLSVFLRAAEHDRFRSLRRRIRSDSVRLEGLKVVSDGAFGPRTAWLRGPYRDAPKETGFPLLPKSDLTTIAREAEALEATLAVHAIGDRAVATALDVFERVRPSRRPRIEHASLTPPDLLRRLDRVRPLLVVQPRFVPSDAWIRERLGPRRARWTYAFRTLLARGHAPVGSSDAPIEPLDPWTGIAAAMAPRFTGAPESVIPEQALAMYTRNAGPALGVPGLGTLEPGAPADLVELDGRPLGGFVRGGGRVRRVWREGRRVDRRSGSAQR